MALVTGFVFGCYATYVGVVGSPPSGGSLLWTGMGVVFVLDSLRHLLRGSPWSE